MDQLTCQAFGITPGIPKDISGLLSLTCMTDTQTRMSNIHRQRLPRMLSLWGQRNRSVWEDVNKNTYAPISRCVQFLNASGSNAVRLMTPTFQCGTLEGPFTVMLVGIATEDGCFLSGLRKRCELGHLYPVTEQDRLTDKSPVCVAMERRKLRKRSSASLLSYPSTSSAGDDYEHADDDDENDDGHNEDDSSEDDDDESDEDPNNNTHNNNHANDILNSTSNEYETVMTKRQRRSTQGRCICPFWFSSSLPSSDGISRTRLPRNNASNHHSGNGDDNGTPTVPQECIHRGSRGPGLWHCYTAVIRPEGSMLRIDGQDEPMANTTTATTTLSSSTSTYPSTLVPLLDGLTIGSDHTFDMSLCFGQGDGDGEGEGAIAELVVFRGVLPKDDLQTLERHLMAKHGVPVPPIGSRLLFQQQDEDRRRAHALLLAQPRQQIPRQGQHRRDVMDDTKNDNKSRVPLSFVAQDPSVSWHRRHPVTGEPVRVSRIGSMYSNGSSDW